MLWGREVSKGTSVCVCLWSWGSASWSCHPFAPVVCSYMKGKRLLPSSFSLFSHLAYPCGAGQSWEISRNKLSALQAEPEREAARGEARGRQSGGEMELYRWSAPNENSCDSWKQLVWLTINANLKLTTEMFFCAKHVISILYIKKDKCSAYMHVYTHIKVTTHIQNNTRCIMSAGLRLCQSVDSSYC